MSRKREEKEYQKSFPYRFSRWLKGEEDPFIGRLEMKPQVPRESPERHFDPSDYEDIKRRSRDHAHNKRWQGYGKLYQVSSVFICTALIALLVYAVSYLPPVGETGNPANNEVPERYITKGLEETGAVNIVTGMILNYRAFDTFGESTVLFVATGCVMLILMTGKPRGKRGTAEDGTGNDMAERTSVTDTGDGMPEGIPAETSGNRASLTEASRVRGTETGKQISVGSVGTETENQLSMGTETGEPETEETAGTDPILQVIAKLVCPAVFLFGIYVILNGHISPGGGFSGGAIIGAGLILYTNAYGFEKTERFFTKKTYTGISVSALSFYCLAKSYSFFTGANHMENMIPNGTPGAIISSGLILPLNICVGLVVSCTIYAFYALFRKGGL
ncbi:MAG: hypothetical protein HFG97_15115 [Dorea sp.]|nr:hypothetical protein [Dorea sp.]